MKKKKLPPVPVNLVRRNDVSMPEPIIVDPFGSYTGRPLELGETPVQDADDL